jgi:phage terminase large subunit-like protein
MQHFLIHGEGDLYGEPYTLLDWHKEFLKLWYECDDSGPKFRWWHEEAIVGAESGASKTEFFAALAVFELCAARGWDGLPPEFLRKSHIITMAAASKEQAGELFRQAQAMCGGTEDARTPAPLSGRFIVQDSFIRYADGLSGRIQRVAAKAATAEGGKESLLLGDELHEWTGNLARVWTVRSKSLTKRMDNPGRTIGMSTAGLGKGSMPPEDTDPLLWRMKARGLMEQGNPDSRFLLSWVQPDEEIIQLRPLVSDTPELREYKTEYLRNALKGMRAADQTWSVEQRLKEILSGKMPWVEALRYYYNMYVNLTAESWLNEMPGTWEEGETPDAAPPDGAEVVVGVDMALKWDSAALVVAGFLPDGRIGWYHKHYPPTDGRIDHVGILEEINTTLANRWQIRAVCYDPKFFELPARMLEDQGFNVVEFKQSIERLVPADGLLYALLRDHKIAHLGGAVLNSHAVNAAWRQSDAGRYLSKSQAAKVPPGHMDLIRAGSMATYELMSMFDDEFFLEVV